MLNHITIMGRLTRDPELRHTQSGTAVASFTVAVDRDFSGQNGGEKQTDFIDCVAWRQTGEFVSKYFRKGSMIVVSGRLQSRKWQDNQGNNRTNWEVNADNVYFGESKKDNGGQQTSSYQQPGSYGYGGYQQPTQAPQGYAPTPAPAPGYHQQTFTELDDSDGELPF